MNELITLMEISKKLSIMGLALEKSQWLLEDFELERKEATKYQGEKAEQVNRALAQGPSAQAASHAAKGVVRPRKG